mmetsp:Transcript_12420/g.18249  ORF Transcript_12420/g.18249 Transcript_12420/m.18249 type:complete len:99 (-) Transcript_12420:211-507(-)
METPRPVEPVSSPLIRQAPPTDPPTAPPATFDQLFQVFETLSVRIRDLMKVALREIGERTSIMQNDAQNFIGGLANATVYGTAYPSGGPSVPEPAGQL